MFHSDSAMRTHLFPFPFQYENEANLFGHWGTTGLTKPNWSDSKGKIKQPREAFDPPPSGWRWDGNWEIKPELSIAFEPDEGLDEWTEDVFENQTRYPLSNWPDESTSFWTDIVSLWQWFVVSMYIISLCCLLAWNKASEV